MPPQDRAAYSFRPASIGDLPRPRRWLNASDVRRWWGNPSGSRLTFETREGFRAGSRRASLRHAIWYFPLRHVGRP